MTSAISSVAGLEPGHPRQTAEEFLFKNAAKRYAASVESEFAMAINPHLVISPQKRLKFLRVIHIHTDWSLAIGEWDRNPSLLVRWNGDTEHPSGNPVSHGYPTWFVLPVAFHWKLLELVDEPNRSLAATWLDREKPADWVDVAWAGA